MTERFWYPPPRLLLLLCSRNPALSNCGVKWGFLPLCVWHLAKRQIELCYYLRSNERTEYRERNAFRGLGRCIFSEMTRRFLRRCDFSRYCLPPSAFIWWLSVDKGWWIPSQKGVRHGLCLETHCGLYAAWASGQWIGSRMWPIRQRFKTKDLTLWSLEIS